MWSCDCAYIFTESTGGYAQHARMFPELSFNIDHGYLEGLVRGFKSGILRQADYLNLVQCETLEGKIIREPAGIINFFTDDIVDETSVVALVAQHPLTELCLLTNKLIHSCVLSVFTFIVAPVTQP